MSGATQNKDGTKKRWIHGRAVQDGKLRFLSVSSLEKGDSSKPTGCLRRWHYQYIGGVKETEQSDALIRGEKLHGEIAHYLTTGEQVLSSQVLAGMHIIPEPGPDLKVEHDIVPSLPDGRSGIANAPLRASGVPIVGAIDLIHARGTNKGTEDIEHIHDPEGTIEVIDWKCLAEGTEIFDVSQSRRRDISESGELSVTSLDTRDSTWQVVTSSATSFPSGEKSCVEVCLRDGSKIVASTDHPILTQRGWVHAANLQTTDLVAVSSRAPEPENPTVASDDEVKFVAYMLSDGGCSGSSMGFTNMTPIVIEEWQKTVTELGYTFRENETKSKARQFYLRGSNENPLREKWNLYGLSKEKRMHPSLWGLPRSQVALFLNRFWACDGYINDHNVCVELASEKLIDDLRFLLLRLGIRARKYHRDSREDFESWVLMVSSMDVPKFLDSVGEILGKEEACKNIRERLALRKSRDCTAYPLNRDGLMHVCEELGFGSLKREQGSRRKEIWDILTRSNGYISRSAFQKFCKEFEYKGPYTKFMVDGLEWERVKQVNEVGTLPVYDLNVPEIHSFSANGIFVHNTCKTMDNAKKGPDLLKTIQMSGYGKYIFEVEPNATFVRLSHGYFPSRGVPRKTTIRVDRDQINKSWEHANHVASSIIDAAKENNPDLVEANTDACMSYGRECPAKSICSAAKTNALSMFVGNVLAEEIIPPGNLLKNMSNANTGNSILASIKAGGSALPEPRANRSIFGSIGQSPAPAPEPTAESAELDRIKGELAARERLAKGPELLPPDAPESNPLLASKPNPVNPFTQAMAAVAEVVEEAPVLDTKEVVASMVKDAPEAPKRRGRKPKSPEPETTPTTPDFSDVDPIAIPVINFFVDCAPDAEHENFWELVDHLSAKLTEQSGLPDFRMATEGDLAFGRWKGFYAAMLRATKIEPGNYTLPHAHGEVAQVVIEVMRDVVRKSGGMFVIGSR